MHYLLQVNPEPSDPVANAASRERAALSTNSESHLVSHKPEH